MHTIVSHKLVIHEGTAIVFLDADAPWIILHPQKIEVVDKQSRCGIFYRNPGLFQ